MGPVAIVGCGLIGTSVGLALRRAAPDIGVIPIDRGESLSAITGADVVVLATPVDAIIAILRDHGHLLGKALIIDTGSTKRAIVATARAARLTNFVGGHPMAGAASSGPAGARADMFDDKPWFLVPHGAAPGTLQRAQTFIVSLGAIPIVFDDDGSEHDRVMSAVSHLPQIVASALMAVVGDAVGERGLQLAGSGLRDTTRLAASNASMWESILASNADELKPLLLKLAEYLRSTAEHLDDASVVRSLFETGGRYRRLVDKSNHK
jgi:prephenate dehydrogenase